LWDYIETPYFIKNQIKRICLIPAIYESALESASKISCDTHVLTGSK
jgi:hypothetical protein